MGFVLGQGLFPSQADPLVLSGIVDSSGTVTGNPDHM